MKWRLLLAMTGLIAMVLVAQDVPLAGYLRKVESERLTAGLQRDAFILAGASEDLLSGEGSGSLIDLQNTIDLYAAEDGARVVVTDSLGRLVASTDPTDVKGDDFTNRPEIAQALTREPATGERPSDTAGGSLVYVAVPVLSGAEVSGVVRITFRSSVIDERANTQSRGLLLVFAIGLVSLFQAVRA